VDDEDSGDVEWWEVSAFSVASDCRRGDSGSDGNAGDDGDGSGMGDGEFVTAFGSGVLHWADVSVLLLRDSCTGSTRSRWLLRSNILNNRQQVPNKGEMKRKKGKKWKPGSYQSQETLRMADRSRVFKGFLSFEESAVMYRKRYLVLWIRFWSLLVALLTKDG
jgi:hypothetical protein